jgi:catechol 2,3-dioxygenase-like lactoylglutathione lyase family enzyme
MATKAKSARKSKSGRRTARGAGSRSKTRAAKKERQQPESLRLRSIMPSYTVNDVQRSLAWYRDGLGFYVEERWEDGGRLKGVMLRAGACELGLSQDDFSKGRDREKGVGFRIWSETAQDVDALAARLQNFGGTIIEGPGNQWDMYSFTALDPDGFKITISQAK